MNKDKIHINNELLAKFLSGEANPVEIDMVLNWVASSDDNIEEFEQFEKIWTLSHNKRQQNKRKAWHKLNKQINKRHNLYLFYSGAAAAVIAILLVLTQLFTSKNPSSTPQFALSSAEKPINTTLPDGSKVRLSENSTIAYSFDAHTNTRAAELSGKAFFNIKRDTTQKFVVHTQYGGVEVLGTQFNVDQLENTDVKVDVLSGKVKVFLPQTSGDTLFLVITANQTATISMKSDTIIKEPQSASAFYEVNKIITFQNQDLKTIISELQQCYEVKIIADSTVNKTLKFTSSFKDSSLEEILTVIAQTHHLTFSRKDDIYIINNDE
jgi:ferric-dicitrate binding protein FerR (iron transport regulator)